MKKAFTMIEIIFVIIILGILASFVIYKINALREDAFNEKQVLNFKTLVNDINTYYTANGELAKTDDAIDLTKMSNVVDSNQNKSYFIFKSSNNKDCFIFTIVQNKIYVQFTDGRKPKGACERTVNFFLKYNIDLSKQVLDLLAINNKLVQ